MMNNEEMIPQYSTVLFTDVWDDVDDFKTDYQSSGIYELENSRISLASQNVLFYLLYARYGNNPIANRDIAQFKYKVFSVIMQYGPTWEKRLDIQDKLRSLNADDILVGSKTIYNHAFNPGTTPSTGSLAELEYINDQSTSNYKKSKMDAYTQLWELLRTDVTEEFLNQFKKCFKVFVSSEQPMLFVTEENEEED